MDTYLSMLASHVYIFYRLVGLNLSRSNQELDCSQRTLSGLLQEAEDGVAPHTHDSISSCNAVLKNRHVTSLAAC